MPELNDKQQTFVDEYLIDLNATQAALRAGYSERTAYSQGQRLLKHVEVQKAIQQAQQERRRRTQVDADRVLLELSRIAFSDVMEHYTTDDFGQLSLAEGAPQGASAAVSSIKRKVRTFTTKEGDSDTTYEVEYKVWDKNTALTNLGKHLGLFVERHEVTGADGAPLFKSFIGVDTDAV